MGNSGSSGGGTGNASAGTGANAGASTADGGSSGGSTGGNSGAGGSTGGAGQGGSGGLDTSFCDAALSRALEQYQGFLAAHTDPASIPRSFQNGTVHYVGPDDWTSGFVAGSLWYLFEYSGDATLRSAAEAWTSALQSQAGNTSTHDVGFMLNSSFGNGLRLTGNEDYTSVLQSAATSLSSRFNATVGATRSWSWGDWAYPVIIDNMMNLELLFRATELGGPASFAEIAVAHALTTLRDHFREDASSYHLVDYDPASGAVLSRETRQGAR